MLRRHPDDLARHNCVRFRVAGTGAICKWEFQVGERLVEHEIGGHLAISHTIFSVEAALDGIGLAYTFEPLVRQHLREKRLKRVLASSPIFPGFCLYYPSRRSQSTKLRALVEYAGRRT